MRGGDDGEAKLLTVTSWQESPLFSEPERLALDYAERRAVTMQSVNDALFARLRQHYTKAQLVEPTAAIPFENFRSKFNPPLGIAAQGFCPLP